ncbi:MAG: hypothetical protein IJK58_08695, partial [Clostridia bacterium]|nr:hypothetical protein [Clostridia bacterium]
RSGGRMRSDAASEQNEMCSDAVVEMTVAAALHEIKRGRVCTVLWLDQRDPKGVCSLTLGSMAELEDLIARLSTVSCVPHERYVSELSGAVPESSNIRLVVVTSNIDPQSVSEIKALPARFGGAGTGCVAEAILFSPADKYEDPAARTVYTEDVITDFTRSGIKCVLLSEGSDIYGAPSFEAVG